MNIFSNDCLAGKKYLITGASSGIGRAAAILMSQCGAQLILGGRDELRLRACLSELNGQEHCMEISDLESADTTYEWLSSLINRVGPLDGVFHCAGVEFIRPAKMLKQNHIDKVFESSLFAAFGICRVLSSKKALHDNGSLVFMSSVAGTTGQNGMSVYSAAKAGIDGLVRSMACEFASRGVRVNSIAAGAVMTAMHDRLVKGSGDEAINAYEKSHLLGFGHAEDIANAAIFLLSDAGRWITGTTLVVDGGYKVR